MAKSTRATRALDALKAGYRLLEYEYDKNAKKIGIQAAEEIGVEPGRVFKTLMTLTDGRPMCALVPSDRELSMKKLAQLVGAKTAAMMPVPDAEKATGYVVGGISPLGRKKETPIAVDELALNYETIFINGGGRGLQIEIEPNTLIRVLGCKVASLVA
ncbi:MAG: Cys-tRNA(Pro) deacylase [Desulfovibrionaceae bacterium]|nr:Cys-tRNA(Pro) deacylase [Desulfovibrionaceae bacterium]